MLISARALRGDSSLCVCVLHIRVHTLSPEDRAWDPLGTALGGPASRGRVTRSCGHRGWAAGRAPSSPGALGAWAQDRRSMPCCAFYSALQGCPRLLQTQEGQLCHMGLGPTGPHSYTRSSSRLASVAPSSRTLLGLRCDGPAARVTCGRMHWYSNVHAWVWAVTLRAPVQTCAGTSQHLPGGAVTTRPGPAVRCLGDTHSRSPSSRVHSRVSRKNNPRNPCFRFYLMFKEGTERSETNRLVLYTRAGFSMAINQALLNSLFLEFVPCGWPTVWDPCPACAANTLRTEHPTPSRARSLHTCLPSPHQPVCSPSPDTPGGAGPSLPTSHRVRASAPAPHALGRLAQAGQEATCTHLEGVAGGQTGALCRGGDCLCLQPVSTPPLPQPDRAAMRGSSTGAEWAPPGRGSQVADVL